MKEDKNKNGKLSKPEMEMAKETREANSSIVNTSEISDNKPINSNDSTLSQPQETNSA